MNPRKAFRKFLQVLFTGGTTFSACILSFIGLYAVIPSLFIAALGVVFVLGFETQVNNEGNQAALKAQFGPKFLKLTIVEKYLDDLIAEESALPVDAQQLRLNNIFYKNYKPKKAYLEFLKKEKSDLMAERDKLLPFYESEKRHTLRNMIREKGSEIKKEKKDVLNLRLFFLKKLYDPVTDGSANKLETAVTDLIYPNANSLKTEIYRKTAAIRLCLLLSSISGISSGLATLSSVQTGITLFTSSNFIPLSGILALSVFAAFGYAMLIQDTMNKVVYKYKKGWIEYSKKRENESTFIHTLRCVLLTGSILLAFAATFATAGTWFPLVNDGAKMLGAVDRVANMLRNIFMIGMVLPTLVYNAVNSIESVNKICKVDYIKLILDMYRQVETAYLRENLIQFLNPFRIAETVLALIGIPFLFLNHVTSVGAGSNRIKLDFIPSMPTIPPLWAMLLVSSNEAVTDGNFLPDKESRRKHSLLLSALFLMVNIPIFILKFPSCLWDCVFSEELNLKKSFEKMFTTQSQELLLKPISPPKPEFSQEWHNQTLLEPCNEIINRLSHENFIQKNLINLEDKTNEKIEKTKKVRAAILDGVFSEDIAMQQVDSLHINRGRFTFWHKDATQAQATLTQALANYPYLSRNLPV